MACAVISAVLGEPHERFPGQADGPICSPPAVILQIVDTGLARSGVADLEEAVLSLRAVVAADGPQMATWTRAQTAIMTGDLADPSGRYRLFRICAGQTTGGG